MLFTRNHNPELISLHIPKTAGTSFRNILKNVYGENEVVRFDIRDKGHVMVNEMPYSKNALPQVKVIHGHFVYENFTKMFTPGKAKIITWVRDPVKRVISNYYYLESRLKDLLQEEKNNLNILSKMQKSLIEYARTEGNKNRQVKFLSGSKPDDFAFIGIQEYFNEEITRLARILQWDKVPEVLFHNKTSKHVIEYSEEIIEEIRYLNLEDEKMYQAALQLRVNSINTI